MKVTLSISSGRFAISVASALGSDARLAAVGGESPSFTEVAFSRVGTATS
jgi:hypothetical protein